MSVPKDLDLEYCLTVNIQQARRRYIFFLSLVGALGLLSLFYDQNPSYAFDIVAIFSGISVCLGLLLYFNRIQHIKVVGFIMCSSIFMHAIVHLIELLYDGHPDTIGVLITSLVWFAFGYSFSTNWTMLIEPYFIGYQLFAGGKKQSPRCLGCKKKD